MADSNAKKQKRGNSLKKVLAYLLDFCKELGYLKDVEKGYKVGKPGYSNKNQFKAPYRIELNDGTEWIIFSTTSQRERIKEQYWDSLNIKLENPSIKESYLVYPDGLPQNERSKFERKNYKIKNCEEYSTLDAMLSQDAFFNRIESYAIGLLPIGKQRDIKGKNFEKRVASLMKNPSNFEKWVKDDEDLEGLHFDLFKKIVACLGLAPKDISHIDAMTDIPLLPSGGPPKTDVLITVKKRDGNKEIYTISCKRSSNTMVSVHQYKADTFAEVLDPNNKRLKKALNEFQACGNKKNMKASEVIALEEEIKPHIYRLCLWALGGIDGEGDSKTQWANYLLVYDNNDEEAMIEPVEEYCKKLSRNNTRTFGTPFSWSYQGKRGESIQLSCPTKLNR